MVKTRKSLADSNPTSNPGSKAKISENIPKPDPVVFKAKDRILRQRKASKTPSKNDSTSEHETCNTVGDKENQVPSEKNKSKGRLKAQPSSTIKLQVTEPKVDKVIDDHCFKKPMVVIQRLQAEKQTRYSFEAPQALRPSATSTPWRQGGASAER